MARHSEKVAIVTGAASGIGAAVARRLAAEGARVCIAERDVAGGEAIAAELGDAALFVPTDVGDSAVVEAMVAAAVARFGRLDILVNNVSSGMPGKVTEVPEDKWLKATDLTLHSMVRTCRYAIPHIARAGGGAIVNIASIAGLAGNYGMACYGTAKAGVLNLTRALALDHAADGIRVNAICPGLIETPATARLRDNPPLWDAYLGGIPMRRVGRADEIAAAVSFLASGEASYVTGATLVVDGGKTAWSGQPNGADFAAAG